MVPYHRDVSALERNFTGVYLGTAITILGGIVQRLMIAGFRTVTATVVNYSIRILH